MRANIGLDACPRDPHIRVLRRTQPGNRRVLRRRKLRTEVMRLVRPRDRERRNGISHAERRLITVQPRLHRRAVEHTREHPKTVQPTMPRLLRKVPGNLQEREEISRAHKCSTKSVELRSLRCKTVRRIRPESMREVAARDTDRPAPELCRGLRNTFPERRVCRRRQPRDSDANKFCRRIAKVLTQKNERDHRPVIERRLLFPDRPRRNILRCRTRGKRAYKVLVVLNADRQLRMPKRPEVSLRPHTRRYMKIVAVTRRVRTDNDDRIGAKRRRRAHRLTIRARRLRYLGLRPRPDGRQNQRRMRHSIGG